ncbi:MAG: PulJ/GspJ family protein, partial [Acidimicrobiales bacterium]
MTLVELMVAMTLFVVVITIGFVVTTAMLTTTTSTQQQGFLTGAAQNGIQTLREFFAGAVPAQRIVTPSGTQLYADECAGGTGGQPFPTGQGSFVSASATDVIVCALRSGANTAYTYEISFTAGSCIKGICTLTVDQEPPLSGWVPPDGFTPTPPKVSAPQPIATIANVICGPCRSSSGTSPFVFSTVPADPNLMPPLQPPPQ